MKRVYLIGIVFAFWVTACTVSPEPINYNYDECAYCKMKISDIRFGAELVTKKGKIYKYDSAECLVRTYLDNDNPEYAFLIVTDYARPHQLIDAATATFLISEKQPSPMGGNLSAYENKEHALMVKEEKGGEVLSFDELIANYRATFK